jgi:putative two-component system response regulator
MTSGTQAIFAKLGPLPGMVDAVPVLAKKQPEERGSKGTLGAANMLDASIAIVDDEMINIKVTRKYLSNAGYHNFCTTDNALEALEMVKANSPDVVLLDVMMPNLSGLEILRRIRETNLIDATPVIVLTASTDPETKMEALELGVTDFIAKPVDPSELVLRVRNALVSKAHQDQLAMYAEHLENEVRLRTEELAISRKEVVECLARAAEYRDEQTGHHIVRVGRYAATLAQHMGLSKQHVELIEQAAQLHDVGKIGIPDVILRKPAKLEPEEFALMKRHCGFGQKILQRMSDEEYQAVKRHPEVGSLIMRARSSKLIELAATIALTHHEWWNGNGYPRGLKGKEIPLEGRLTAIADVYDALTSERPYKEAFSHLESMAMIAERSGTQFDPDLVEILRQLGNEFDRIRRDLAD